MSEAESGKSEQMFRCKRCPNQEFTAAEKDSHRRMHNENVPIKVRGGGGRRRGTSPTGTDVTLFQPIADSPGGSPVGPGPASRKKARSHKKYDRGVKHRMNDGG